MKIRPQLLALLAVALLIALLSIAATTATHRPTGTYQISGPGSDPVLLDTTTGQAWRLVQTPDHVVWLPLPAVPD